MAGEASEATEAANEAAAEATAEVAAQPGGPTPTGGADGAPDGPGYAGGLVGLLALLLLAWPGAPALPPPASAGPPPLRLELVDPLGAPVAGAEVRWRAAEQGVEVRGRSDAEGAVALVIPAASGAIRVRASGYAPLERPLPGPREAPLVLTLDPARRLEGVVVDPDGAPLEGAALTVFALDAEGAVREDREPWRATSDARGRFGIAQVPVGPLRLRASHRGHATHTRRVLEEEDSLTVVLAPAAELTGLAYGADGLPAAGATISLVGSGVWPPREIASDAGGRFAFDGVPPGIYEVHAWHGSEVAPPRRGVEVEAGAPTYVSLRMLEGETLGGVVVDEAGAPIAGAEVAVTETGVALLPRTTRTDAAGAFRFQALLPTTGGPASAVRWLTAQAPGHVPTTAAVTPPGPVSVVLPRGARVSGVVLDARDRPVVGAVVRWLAAEPGGNPAGALVPSPGRLSVTTGPVPPLPLDAITTGLGPAPTPALRPSGASTVTDGAGRFVLEGLPPGLGELHAEHATTAPARSDAMRLSAGEARTDLTLVAPEGGVVEGRVVDARGFPVGAVPLELRAEREPWPRGRLAEPDGTFRFEGVLGVAVLLARPAELPTVRERLEVGDGERVQVELVVETELSQLALRVFDDDGFPLEGASLTLSSLAARTPLRRVGLSGPDGTFVFSALPPPPWRLAVDHPEHAPVERVVATGEGEQRITLAEGGTVRGRVVDPWSEEPLAGVSVRLEGETLSRTLPTDAEGRFAAERLPRGRYVVALELPGRLPIEEEVSLGGEEVEVELQPEQGGELRGQVVDVLGDAVEGATVRAGRGEAEGRAAGEAESDAAGRFAMLLPPGLHAVLAEHPRAGRAEGPRVRVERGGSVSVRLVTDGRLPVDEEEEAAAEILTGVPVSVARRGGAVVVTAVHGAGAARVRVGDELLSVDDEPVLAASQARGMLRGPAGDRAVLVVRRGGRERRVVARRERHTR